MRLEMTLGANLPLAKMNRLSWLTSEKESSHMADSGMYFVTISHFSLDLFLFFQ